MRTTASTASETAENSKARKATDDKASRSLSIAALLFVALAAIMGWGASFVGLHEYGMQSMAGFTYWTAWLVPATFDGAAFACTLMTYRSSINGRSAVRGRILMWAFTAVSSWINWIHQPSPQAQIVAAGLPIAAVAVFDVVLTELRADYEKRHGKRGFRLRPGLLLLRWMVDRSSTSYAFRKQVIDIPVEEIAGLGPVSQASDEAGDTTIDAEPQQGRGEFVSQRASLPPAPAPRSAIYEQEPAAKPQYTAKHAAVDVPETIAAGPSESAEEASSETSHAPYSQADELAEPGLGEVSEETVMLPRLPEQPMSDEDKREAARRDYRESLDADQPVTGAQLGKRYGMSERWGRTQISAAREEMRHERHPRLVAVNARD